MPSFRSPAQIFGNRPLPVIRAYGEGETRLETAETGNPAGPLVVFIHGTPGNWQSLLELMGDPALGKRALLVAVDRPGWGGSRPKSPLPSIAGQADALKPILDAHPANLPAVVVGHSYGGPVAAKLAMDEPGRVGALIMVAGSIDPEQEKTTWYQAVSRWPLIRSLVPRALRNADLEVAPMKEQLTAMLPGWSALLQPVTVIQGDRDKLVPPANADFAERVITRAPLRVIRLPGQGHFIPWENPAVITTAILDALPPAGTK